MPAKISSSTVFLPIGAGSQISTVQFQTKIKHLRIMQRLLEIFTIINCDQIKMNMGQLYKQ